MSSPHFGVRSVALPLQSLFMDGSLFCLASRLSSPSLACCLLAGASPLHPSISTISTPRYLLPPPAICQCCPPLSVAASALLGGTTINVLIRTPLAPPTTTSGGKSAWHGFAPCDRRHRRRKTVSACGTLATMLVRFCLGTHWYLLVACPQKLTGHWLFMPVM